MIIRFDDLSEADARFFFQAFVARMPARLAAFRREIAAEGGPAESDLDASPESLVPLWRWFVATFGAVEEGTRPPPAWDDLPPWYAPDEPGDPDALPPWVVWFADGLTYYWAACFQRSHPEMHWELGTAPKRLRVVDENHPLLRGHGIQMSPLQLMTVAVRGVVVQGVDREPDRLLRLHERWAGYAAESQSRV
jgi:hypothetical protein